jgi:phage/plasmid-like protein (TIGR03299 family)
MPAYFTQGFMVNTPAWHGLGTVLDYYPGRTEAMRLAGHDYRVVSFANGDVLTPLTAEEAREAVSDDIVRVGGVWHRFGTNPDKKGLRVDQIREDGSVGPLHGNSLEVANTSYAEIQNSVPYDFAELLLEQGFQYETGITMKDGALCAITLVLDEPIQITGDNSISLPYLGLSWSHDGSGSFRGRSTTVRQVCANTVAASEAEGKRLGTDFSIRHTKNWHARIEDAKKALMGVRADVETYREAMEVFAAMPVTVKDRELFVRALVLDQTVASVSRFKADVAKNVYSSRVQNNVENAEAAALKIFETATIPDEHKLTGFGLFQAGVEYLDHVRKAQNDASKVGRSLLRDEPAKARLPKLINEIVSTGGLIRP